VSLLTVHLIGLSTLAVGFIGWALWVRRDMRSFEDWAANQRAYSDRHYDGATRREAAARRTASRRQWLERWRAQKRD